MGLRKINPICHSYASNSKNTVEHIENYRNLNDLECMNLKWKAKLRYISAPFL